MNKIWLIIIILLAFLIRIYHINFPPLLWDEASLGYNAYSIIKTGADEYGQKFPLIFKSFGDYKPGAYVYLSAPFVALFGLNSTAVRLPSIILGSLLPLIIYLIVITLSPKNTKLGLIAATVLAFNPFNIHYSRGAWETNILTFELALVALLFFRKHYLASALTLGISLYTYQGAKLMAPAILTFLLILDFKEFFNSKINSVKLFLPLVIFSLPLVIGLLTQSDANRLQVFSLWSYPRSQSEAQQLISEGGGLDYQIFHNQFFFFLRGFSERYFNFLSTKFLIFEGDWQIARQSAPYIGMMLYPSLIFLAIGLSSLFKSKNNRLDLFFLFWLLFAPIPAALTRDIIQPVRAMSFSIPLVYFVALGILTIIEFIKTKSIRYIATTSIVIAYTLSFIYYGDLYLNHMVKVKPSEWLFGYQPAMQYLLAKSPGKSVTFTDFYGQPYIYYLFYSQYSPAKYQSQAHLTTNGLDTGKVESIDNIQFKTPDFNSLKQKPHQLMVFSYDDAIRQGIDLKLLTPLSPVNGISTFYGYETN